MISEWVYENLEYMERKSSYLIVTSGQIVLAQMSSTLINILNSFLTPFTPLRFITLFFKGTRPPQLKNKALSYLTQAGSNVITPSLTFKEH